MANRPEIKAILNKLDEVEAEMKAIGYWDEKPGPAPDSFLGPEGFEAWLQRSFLPAARKRVDADDLPDRSDVGVAAMRQYDYHGTVPEALRLMKLLYEFDHLVGVANTAKQRAKKSRR